MGRAVALAILLSGCGYRIVRPELPATAGGCVVFDGLDGGGSYPAVAALASAELRAHIAPDLCPSKGTGSILTGEVDAVEQAAAHLAVGEAGPVRSGGRWLARATVRIERGGLVVWGPLSVEVERDFLTTGSALAEGEALDAHLELLAGDLARAIADLLHGVHPITVEASP